MNKKLFKTNPPETVLYRDEVFTIIILCRRILIHAAKFRDATEIRIISILLQKTTKYV